MTDREYSLLCQEYQDWQERHGLSLGSADEHVDDENLSEEQKAWLNEFIQRWEALKTQESQAASDPEPEDDDDTEFDDDEFDDGEEE